MKVLELGRSMPFLVGVVWSLVLPEASFFDWEA